MGACVRAIAATLIFAVVSSPCAGQNISIDQMPMYGGFDRSSEPALKASDELLIQQTTEHYGSRSKASAAFVGNGFAFYQRDEYDKAIRRFNQAWLLDPKNPEVYAGFASVLSIRGQYCEATEMMERALALDPPTFQGIFTDAGLVMTRCAVKTKEMTDEKRSAILQRANQLFQRAEQVEPNKAYLYQLWAQASFDRGDYATAWAMVKRQREAGGKSSKPDEVFLKNLREKLPEPA